MGMVRIATVVLVLVAAPVFAASVVTYELQLGGDNHASAIKAGTRTAYTQGAASDGQVYAPGVLNWAAALAVSGNQDQPGHPSNGLAVQGVANFVINLELHSGSAAGPLVTNVSYYSTIHDGAGALACTDCKGGYTLPGPTPFCAGSAFAYVFNIGGLNWGYGTAIEAISALQYTGPYMGVGMYPTVDVGNTSGEGQLLGVGAGYGQWSRGGGFATMTSKGVGIPTASGGLGVLPLVEGQIDTSQLANGTYVLKLVPGAGHNVLRGDVDLVSPPAAGNPEVQAFAVPANQVNGDTITFTIGTPVILAVTPNNQNMSAGGGSTSFTVSNAGAGTLNYNASTGDSWLHITGGASGSCPPDATISVTVDANSGATPRVGTITVTAAGAQGSPKSVTVTQEGLVPIVLTSAASVRTHGTSGEFGVNFFPISTSTECRTGSPTTLVYTFNRLPLSSGGGAVTANDLLIYGDFSAPTITNVVTNGSSLRVSITGAISPDRLYTEFPGVVDSDSNPVSDITCLGIVHGDSSNDRNTNSSDYVYVRGRIGQPVSSSNFRADVNSDGNINSSDYVAIRGRIGQTYGGC